MMRHLTCQQLQSPTNCKLGINILLSHELLMHDMYPQHAHAKVTGAGNANGPPAHDLHARTTSTGMHHGCCIQSGLTVMHSDSVRLTSMSASPAQWHAISACLSTLLTGTVPCSFRAQVPCSTTGLRAASGSVRAACRRPHRDRGEGTEPVWRPEGPHITCTRLLPRFVWFPSGTGWLSHQHGRTVCVV